MPSLSFLPDDRPMFVPPGLRTDNSLGVWYSTLPGTVPNVTRYALSNYGKAAHDEYYLDVPGVNIANSVPLVLNLQNSTLGTYIFNSSAFFPIDGSPQAYSREVCIQLLLIISRSGSGKHEKLTRNSCLIRITL